MAARSKSCFLFLVRRKHPSVIHAAQVSASLPLSQMSTNSRFFRLKTLPMFVTTRELHLKVMWPAWQWQAWVQQTLENNNNRYWANRGRHFLPPLRLARWCGGARLQSELYFYTTVIFSDSPDRIRPWPCDVQVGGLQAERNSCMRRRRISSLSKLTI